MIPSRYITESTGELHESLLLCSECWAIVRHPNYVGDLIFSFCTCVCCGWQYLVPYTYFIWMAVLLIHRCLRNEKRCLAKHGKAWEEYRRVVRWRMVPGIFRSALILDLCNRHSHDKQPVKVLPKKHAKFKKER